MLEKRAMNQGKRAKKRQAREAREAAAEGAGEEAAAEELDQANGAGRVVG